MLSKPQPRAEQKQATRESILRAARAELERVGYQAANLRAIAREAGVSTGAVLLHFQDKQDLFHAALFHRLEQCWHKVRESKPPRSLEAALTAIASAFFDYYATHPTLSRTLLRESLFAADPWRERFAGQVGEVHRHVAMLLDRAKSRGEISATADPELFGAAFFSFYYFALLAWLQGGHPQPLRLFKRLLQQHLDGLR